MHRLQGMLPHRTKFTSYTLASAIGLLLSTLVFHCGHSYWHLSAFVANWLGDLLALQVVFWAAQWRIFDSEPQQVHTKWLLHLLSKLVVIQALSMILASVSSYLEHTAYSALVQINLLTLTKLTLAPISLLINYLITHLIIDKNPLHTRHPS